MKRLTDEVKDTKILAAGSQVMGWEPEWPNVKFLSGVYDLIRIAGPKYSSSEKYLA